MVLNNDLKTDHRGDERAMKEDVSMARDRSNAEAEDQLLTSPYTGAGLAVTHYDATLEVSGQTFTMYLARRTMGNHGQMNVKEPGRRLCLDSGTLTPVLKKLENAGPVKKQRSSSNERRVTVELTREGKETSEALQSTLTAQWLAPGAVRNSNSCLRETYPNSWKNSMIPERELLAANAHLSV